MARCPRCGSEAIEEINYNTYKCHECGYVIRNPDDLDLADEEYGYWFQFLSQVIFMPVCPACWCPFCFEYGDGSYRCMECGCIFEDDEDSDSD